MQEFDEVPLFETVHQALTFAFNYSAGSISRPLMHRLGDKHIPTGKGLSGNDGAAQAGMILRRLTELSPLHQAILMARFAPRDEPCPCCKARKARDEWMEACRVVSDSAAVLVEGVTQNRVLRHGLVARYFGQKVHLQTLAAGAGVHRDTASHHNSLVVQWLRGTRDKVRKGELVRAGEAGEEQLAMDAAEAVACSFLG